VGRGVFSRRLSWDLQELNLKKLKGTHSRISRISRIISTRKEFYFD
jgi:hypothetical protein